MNIATGITSEITAEMKRSNINSQSLSTSFTRSSNDGFSDSSQSSQPLNIHILYPPIFEGTIAEMAIQKYSLLASQQFRAWMCTFSCIRFTAEIMAVSRERFKLISVQLVSLADIFAKRPKRVFAHSLCCLCHYFFSAWQNFICLHPSHLT